MKFDTNFKLSKKELNRGLKFPKEFSKDFAELIGIHFGDGHLQIKPGRYYAVSYSFNIRDKQYSLYVKDIFYRLFNINMSMEERINKNAINLYYNSKSLCTFFNKVLQIPSGPKKQLSIPNYIKSNDAYLRCFLRGIFDTDGCITIQKMGKYQYKLIKICTACKTFAEELKIALKSLEINSYICRKTWNHSVGYDVTIRRKDSFCRFLELIKPKNNKGKINGDAGI